MKDNYDFSDAIKNPFAGKINNKYTIVESPDDDISAKFNLLPDDVKRAIRIIIDNTLKQKQA